MTADEVRLRNSYKFFLDVMAWEMKPEEAEFQTYIVKLWDFLFLWSISAWADSFRG